MPSKRSRSEEREKKRKARLKMSEEQREHTREVDRIRKKEENERRCEEGKEFEKIKLKHRIRELRNQRTGKEKLQQNLDAKRGMRLLNEKGSLNEFQRRRGRNTTEMFDWEIFVRKGKKQSEIVEDYKPDIVERINKKMRKEKENLDCQ